MLDEVAIEITPAGELRSGGVKVGSVSFDGPWPHDFVGDWYAFSYNSTAALEEMTFAIEAILESDMKMSKKLRKAIGDLILEGD